MALRLPVGNMDDVQDGFTPMPEGIYRMQISEITMQTSKNNKQYIKVKQSVLQPTEHIGRIGFANISLEPNALWKLKQFCKAVGITWDKEGVDVEPAIGRELDVKVTCETYEPPDGAPRVTNRFDDFVV